MAKIRKDTEQLQALREIESKLEQLSLLNARIDDTRSPVRLVCDGKKQAFILLHISLTEKIAKLLILQKKILIREIRSKADAFRIDFSAEEEALLDCPC